MSSKPTAYRSYLLRLWLIHAGPQQTWRAALEDPRTGERMAFATLERLYLFLADQAAGDDIQRCGAPEQEV